MTGSRSEPPESLESLVALFARHGVDAATEEPFPNDGWSGATMTRVRTDDGRSLIVKRDSLEQDWIAQATHDGPILREAWFAAHGPALPWPARAPYLGAGIDEATGRIGILMPDLSGVLFDWNAGLSVEQLDRVLDGLVNLHAHPWGEALATGAPWWTPWLERLTLICRTSLERDGPARTAVADRLLPGWDAWDRLASPRARVLIGDLAANPDPLLAGLAALPSTLLHGDLKLANVGIAADGAVDIVDWQMAMVAPVAVELGWFLVANVNALPLPAPDVLDRYWSRRDADRRRQDDAAILVGLLLRGWRKGMDAEAGVTLGSGISARDDLAWWCERAVEAADRLF